VPKAIKNLWYFLANYILTVMFGRRFNLSDQSGSATINNQQSLKEHGDA
jgi:hypothetical protein